MSYAVIEGRTEVNTPYATGPVYEGVIRTCTDEAEQHFLIPVSRWVESPEERFQRLARSWRRERGPTSSLTEMVTHPAYQEIIGLGREAIPLLLRELQREPDHWFWALKAITGVDPVPPEARGKIQEMARAWLRWGREHGLGR